MALSVIKKKKGRVGSDNSMWCSVTSVKLSKRRWKKIISTSRFLPDSFTSLLYVGKKVFNTVFVNSILFVSAPPPQPVCGALDCCATSRCTCHMSLRCHNAAWSLLIFLMLHCELLPHKHTQAHTLTPFHPPSSPPHLLGVVPVKNPDKGGSPPL